MTRPLSLDHVRALAETAASRNHHLGVTGLLFCMSDRFIQLLEGESALVGAMFDRILADPRHEQVTKVLDATVDRRSFTTWSMRLITEDELTLTEQAIVIDALRSIDPIDPPPHGGWRLGDLLASDVGPILEGALPASTLPAETLETFDRLLFAAETIMFQRGALKALTLKEVARRARVGEDAVRVHFKTIDDLLAVGVRRILVIEYRKFIEFMRRHTFLNREEIAVAIVEFVIQCNADRLGMSPTFRRRIMHGHDEVSAAAATVDTVASTLNKSLPRAGWPCPDIGARAIAASLAAVESVARALTRDDEAALTDPEAPALLYDVCLAALEPAPAVS
jgi:AcrR family transcriptional regulator